MILQDKTIGDLVLKKILPINIISKFSSLWVDPFNVDRNGTKVSSEIYLIKFIK